MNYCEWCSRKRSNDELLLVYRRGDPTDRFYVCRPLLQGGCFRHTVGPRSHWVIEPAGIPS
jgi:hypothetical protein